jgi:hypothetical protein
MPEIWQTRFPVVHLSSQERFHEEDGLPGHKRVHARLPTRYARQ